MTHGSQCTSEQLYLHTCGAALPVVTGFSRNSTVITLDYRQGRNCEASDNINHLGPNQTWHIRYSGAKAKTGQSCRGEHSSTASKEQAPVQ